MPLLEKALRRDYDNIIHLAASIEDGYTSATSCWISSPRVPESLADAFMSNRY
jgi:hypothetical protein